MNSFYGWIPVTMFRCPACGGLEQDMDDAVCSHKCEKSSYTTETNVLKVIEQADQIRKNPQPLFTSKVDSRGRLTIRSDVRQRKGIKPGDSVDVIEIEKVISNE